MNSLIAFSGSNGGSLIQWPGKAGEDLRHKDIQGKSQGENGGRDRDDASKSQEMTRIAKSHQKLKKTKNTSLES